MSKDNLSSLYKGLIKKGYSASEIGDEATFRSKMADKQNRKQLYDYVSSRGDFRIGDYDSYEKRLSEVVTDYSDEPQRQTESPAPVPVSVQMEQQNEAPVQEISQPRQQLPKKQRQSLKEQAEMAFAIPDEFDMAAKFADTPPVYDPNARLQKALSEGRLDTIIKSDEEERISAEFTPKPVADASDIYSNYSNRFSLTERGKQLYDELSHISSQIQEKYAKEFLKSDEYKALQQKYSGEELNRVANEAFSRAYSKRIDAEMEPYTRAYQKEAFSRYENEIARELDKYQDKQRQDTKAEIASDVSSLTASVDNQLEKNHRKLASQAGSGNNAFNALMGSRGYNMATAKDRKSQGELEAARALLEESQNIIDEARRKGKTNFVSGVGRGFADTAFNAETWSFGLSDMRDAKVLMDALDKFDRGEELTQSEQTLMDAAVANMATNAYYYSDLGRGYKAGMVTGQSVPFMLEFAVNPVSASGSSIAKSILKYGMKKFGKSAVKNNAAKFAARLIGDATAAASMTGTSSAARVAAGTIERMGGDIQLDDTGTEYAGRKDKKELGESLGKSFASTFLENQSEMVFNAFSGLGAKVWKAADQYIPGGTAAIMDNAIMGKAGEIYRKIKSNPTLQEVAKRTQFHGLGEEYLEEVYNNFANIPLGEMTLEEATDLDNNIDTFLGLAPTSVAFGMLGLGGLANERIQHRKKIKAALGNLTRVEAKRLKKLEALAEKGGNEDIKAFIRETILDKGLTPEEKKAEIEYAYNLAVGNAIDDIDATQQQEVQENSMNASQEGAAIYAEHNPGTMRQTVLRREVTEQRLIDAGFSAEDIEKMKSTPVEERQQLLSSMDDVSANSATDFFNAFDREEAMNEALDTAHEDEVFQARNMLQDIVLPNQTVTVVPLGKYGTEQTQYGVVVSGIDAQGNPTQSNGAVVTYPVQVVNGVPDFSTIDKSKAVVVIPKSYTDAMIFSPDEAFNGMLTSYQQDAAILEGTPIIPGAQFPVMLDDGSMQNITVAGTAPTGESVIVTPDGKTVNMPIEELSMRKRNAEQAPIMAEYAEEEQIQQQAVQEAATAGYSEEVKNLRPQTDERLIVDGQNAVITEISPDGLIVGLLSDNGDIIGTKTVPLETYYDYKQSQFNQQDNVQTQSDKNTAVPVNELPAEGNAADSGRDTADTEGTQQKEETEYPIDEAGEPAFLQMQPEQTIQLLNDTFAEDAPNFVRDRLSAAKSAAEKAAKKSPKALGFNERAKELSQIREEREKAAREVEYWQNISSLMNPEVKPQPKAQAAPTIMEEAEAETRNNQERLAAMNPEEIAAAQAKVQENIDKGKYDRKPVSRKRSRYNDEDLAMGEAYTPMEHVLRAIATGRVTFQWSDKGTTQGLGSHLGASSSTAERQKLIWALSNEGYVPEVAAEVIHSDMPAAMQGLVTDQDIFNMILEAFMQYGSPSRMFEAAQHLHGNDIESQSGYEEDMERQQLEWEAYHNNMSVEDWSVLLDIVEEELEYQFRTLTDEDINNIFEEIYNEQYGTGRNEAESAESTQRSTDSEGGNEVQPQQRSYNETTDGGSEVRPQETAPSDEQGSSSLSQPGFTVEKRYHKKDNKDIFAVNFTERMERDAFLAAKKKAKEAGGYYSSFGKGGFIFDTEEAARNFAQGIVKSPEKAEEEDNNALAGAQLPTEAQKGKTYLYITQELLNSLISKGEEVRRKDRSAYREIPNLYRIDEIIREDFRRSIIENAPVQQSVIDELKTLVKNTPLQAYSELIDKYIKMVEISQAESEVNTNPTEAQKKAGNYKMGHVKVDGMDITIENPKGSERSGTDKDGNKWSVTMNNTYGYIRGTEGVDGDHIDVFLSDNPESGKVFVVDQVNEDGSFDEHKVMYGFDTRQDAEEAYLANYSPGWTGLGQITEVSKEQFRKWIDSSHRKTKPFAEYQLVASSGKQEEKNESDKGVPEKIARTVVGRFENMVPNHPVISLAYNKEDIYQLSEEGFTSGEINLLIKDCLNTGISVGAYVSDRNRIVIFPGNAIDEFDLESGIWHENTHYLIHTSKDMDYNNLPDDALLFLKENHPEDYEYIISQYPEEHWNEEAIAFLIQKKVDDYGAAAILNATFEGNEQIVKLFNTILKEAKDESKRRTSDSNKSGYAEQTSQTERRTASQKNESGSTVSEKYERGKGKQNNEAEIINSDKDDIRFRIEDDTDIVARFSTQHNLNQQDVSNYARYMQMGNLNGAARAFHEIRRKVLLDHYGISLGEFTKLFSPIRNSLYEHFGNVDDLREEYVQRTMEERNMMEAARKRAQEEAEAEKKRLEEFRLMNETEMDAAYFSALEAGNENRMRDIVNEAARRNGYLSEFEYRMAHRAPSFDEEGPGKNLIDVANNKDNIRDSLNEQMRMNKDTNREESSAAISKAISDIEKSGKATVTIYRAVPKSLKEGSVRNGDWVTLSESYARQHGNHALEGNYRIIKEDVPAENLYWDGNDINEWGYDDKSDYLYKNTKNNRKLNDLVTRDDKGNVIPPSKRFNSRKSDMRFRFIGEQGAARLDAAEEATTRLDNLSVARKMESDGKDASSIKYATGWERGGDGKWRYETMDIEYIPDGKARKNKILEDKEWYSEFAALSDKLFNDETLTESEQKRFDELSEKADAVREQYEMTEKTYLDDYIKDKELFIAYPLLNKTKVLFIDNPDFSYSGKADSKENQIIINLAKSDDVKSVLVHEIQHMIQSEEGFARGGNESTAKQIYDKFMAWSWRNELIETQKENPGLPQGEVEKILIEEYKETGMEDMIPPIDIRTKGFNLFARGYDKEGYEDAWKYVSEGKIPLEIKGQEYNIYNKLSGEVESRNVQTRIDMTPEQRRQSLAEETEDVSRKDQIFISDAYDFTLPVLNNSEQQTIKNINEQAAKLNIPVTVYTSIDQVPQGAARRALEKGLRVKGWYHDGNICVYLPNADGMEDIKATLLHEGVAHYGLRKMVGVKNFNAFMDGIYAAASPEVRKEIVRLLPRYDYNMRVAVEEYLATLAESGTIEPTFWEKVKQLFRVMLENLGFTIELTDNDLRYILWESRNNLRKSNNPLETAKETVMRKRFGIGMFSSRKTEDTLFRFEDRPALVQEYDAAIDNNSFRFQEAFQDSMLSLKVLQELIERQSGKPIRTFENAYTAENRLSSINKVDNERYLTDFFEPLLNHIDRLAKMSSREQVEDYIYAKSGLERNEVFLNREAQKAYDEAKKELDGKLDKGDITQPQYDALMDKVQADYDKMISEGKDYSGLTGLVLKHSADELSGITDDAAREKRKKEIEKEYKEHAESIVSEFENKIPAAEVYRLWQLINSATNENLRKQFDSGIISAEKYEELKNMMQYYVPLRGWQESIAEDFYDYTRKETPVQKEKSAKGRKSLADNPIANIALSAQNAIILGNRNKMKQRFYNFIINRPNELVTVRDQWYARTVHTVHGQAEAVYPGIEETDDAKTIQQKLEEFEKNMKEMEELGLAFRRRTPLGVTVKVKQMQKPEHTVSVMINGQEYVMYINGNPRAAQALNGKTNPEGEENIFWEYYNKAKRFYGGGLTSNNPDFVAANFVRDSIHSATMQFLNNGIGSSARFVLNTPKSFKAVFRGVLGKYKPGSKTDQYFQEFIQNGGETGYTAVHTIEDYKHEYDKALNDLKGIKAVAGAGKKGLEGVIKALEVANRIAEDVNRFNAYMSSREAGKTIEESIDAAKNITVNFNKKGALGKGKGAWAALAWFMNKWILFFNPAVQGLYQVGQSAANNKKRVAGTLATIAASGFIMPYLNSLLISALGGDGDDDYFNQTDYTRMNNWLIYIGNGYAKIPLPPFFREIYGLGDIFYRLMTGRITPERASVATLRQVQSAIGFINLIPEGEPNIQEAVSGVMPDIIAPLMDVAFNRDFTGRDIAKDTEWTNNLPEYERIYKGVSPVYVEFSRLLNQIGGDDARRSPLFGTFINPAYMEHIITAYTGGIGKTISNLSGAAADLAMGNPDNIEFRTIPVVNRFGSPVTERSVTSATNRVFFDYLERYEAMKVAEKRYKQFIKDGRKEFRQELEQMKKNGEIEMIRYFDTKMKVLRKLQNALKENPDNKGLEKRITELKKEMSIKAKAILR